MLLVSSTHLYSSLVVFRWPAKRPAPSTLPLVVSLPRGSERLATGWSLVAWIPSLVSMQVTVAVVSIACYWALWDLLNERTESPHGGVFIKFGFFHDYFLLFPVVLSWLHKSVHPLLSQGDVKTGATRVIQRRLRLSTRRLRRAKKIKTQLCYKPHFFL